MTNTPPKKHLTANSKGFTLIELMLTLLISFFVIGAISTAYQSQQKSQTNLSQKIQMQQQLRSLMTFLSSELRMAGLDPTESSDMGLQAVTVGSLRFTMDTDENGLSDGDNEDIEYGFENALVDDADNDGEADAGFATFCRRRNNAASTAFESLADNIVAIEFLSVLEDTSDNDEYDPDTTLTPTAAELSDIRSISISILIRANNADQSFTNNNTYTSASGAIWGPYDDNFRRQLLITNVKLRNIGL